ncbi:MAG: hypothetical protein RR806_04625 [Oscillospiraceae bacterium]
MKNNKKIIAISLILLTIASGIGIPTINRTKKEPPSQTQLPIVASSEKPTKTPTAAENPTEKDDDLPIKEAPPTKPTQQPKPTPEAVAEKAQELTPQPPAQPTPPPAEKPQPPKEKPQPPEEKPQPPVPQAEHYHGNGTDSGTCPACGLGYSPNIDMSGGDGATDIGGTWE